LDVNKLNELLEEAENNEEYETCSRYRDLISEAKK
jgi:protein-arginine kinase activator protein McsA